MVRSRNRRLRKLVCRLLGHAWEPVEDEDDDDQGLDTGNVAHGTENVVCRRCGTVKQDDVGEPRFEDPP